MPQYTFYFICLGEGDPAVQGGEGVSRGVGDIFVGSASVFILLGRTSEINSPKNITPQCTFYFRCLGGGDPAVQGGGGIPRCRVGSPSRAGSPNALHLGQQ